MTDTAITSLSDRGAISSELASRNTGLAVQRTRMAADRTLMAIIRTSLSLISFGFTIFQLVQRLAESRVLQSDDAPVRHFGIALVLLGIAMLILGILYHGQFMFALRVQRRQMTKDGLIHGKSPFPPSLTLITAVALLVLGLTAIISMVYRVGPFG
jgi:putative membrane protein